MGAPSYLKQRKHGWYVQLAVPRQYQAAVGAKVLVRSLGTRDKSEANRRKHAALVELQSLIAQAAAKAQPPPSPEVAAQRLLQDAMEARAAIERGTAVDPLGATLEVERGIATFLEAQAKAAGPDAQGEPEVSPEVVATVRRAHKALSGRLEYTLGRQLERYLQEAPAHLTAQTVVEKRRRLGAFRDWFGADREAAEVTRKVAGTYVAEVIQRRVQKLPDGEAPLSPTTKKKEISDLRAFFEWMSGRGVIDTNPFDRMSATVKESTKGKSTGRRPWTPEELGVVLRGVEQSDPLLWAMTAIAAYSGMRREEICELKTSDVSGRVLLVREGKTAAAVRRVPIHPTISPLIRRLVSSSADGYLLPGLLRGGPDQKRGWYIGKRFGRVIRKLGITDASLDFHALRGTVVTQLEGAGVPLSTIQLIVGHKREGMTLGVYSQGVPDSVKEAAIARVSYGKSLDGLVMGPNRGKVSARGGSRKQESGFVRRAR